MRKTGCFQSLKKMPETIYPASGILYVFTVLPVFMGLC